MYWAPVCKLHSAVNKTYIGHVFKNAVNNIKTHNENLEEKITEKVTNKMKPQMEEFKTAVNSIKPQIEELMSLKNDIKTMMKKGKTDLTPKNKGEKTKSKPEPKKKADDDGILMMDDKLDNIPKHKTPNLNPEIPLLEDAESEDEDAGDADKSEEGAPSERTWAEKCGDINKESNLKSMTPENNKKVRPHS